MKTDQANTEQKLIAENEQLKQLLKQANDNSDRWYKTLFNQSKEATLVCEMSSSFPSTVIDCNDEFLRITKNTFANLIGRDFMDLMRRGEKQRFFIQALNKNKEDNIVDLPFVFKTGDGSEINMEISSRRFRASDKDLVIITLHPENTYRSILNKGIEQLLANSSQIFFSIKEENVLLFDYISFSIYKVTGYSPSELKINPTLFWNNCHPEDLKKLKAVIKKKANFQNKINLRFICSDGQMIWLEFALLRSDENNQYYAVAREITALQKQQRLNAKKEQYIQTTLHVSEMFISGFDLQKFLNFNSYINRQLQSDILSVYALDAHHEIDHITFQSHVTLEEKTYTPSNISFWNEFKDHFTINPVMVYHSESESIDLNENHVDFFIDNKLESALIVPLLHQKKIKGFIACSTLGKAKRWDRTDINFLSQLSKLLSLALYT